MIWVWLIVAVVVIYILVDNTDIFKDNIKDDE
jgi:hypothetical protein